MKASKLTKETVLSYGLEDRGFPSFGIGDKVAVSQLVKEGDKEREQKFEGIVISMRGTGAGQTFTVRRASSKGIAVEKIFPYYSPIISAIELVRSGKIRRAKLYYLRGKVGKETKIKGH